SSQVNLPQELSKDITFLQFDLPDVNALDSVFHEILSSVAISVSDLDLERQTQEARQKLIEKAIEDLNITDEDRYRIVQAALGLTCAEAENAFALTWVEHKSFTSPEAVAYVQKVKTQFINSSG